jgi:hypothetical protein
MQYDLEGDGELGGRVCLRWWPLRMPASLKVEELELELTDSVQ